MRTTRQLQCNRLEDRLAPANIRIAAGDSAALIAAVKTANNETTNPGLDTILLTNSTYTFSAANNWWFGPNALPAITSKITIQGDGATLRRDPNMGTATDKALRLLFVAGGLNGLSTGTLTLQNITLTGGQARGGNSHNGGGGGGMGGAIFNMGSLKLASCTISGNTAQGGHVLGQENSNLGGGIGQDAIGGYAGGFGGAFVGGSGGSGGYGSYLGGGGGGGFIISGAGAGSTGGNGGGVSGLGGQGILGGLGGDGGGGGINGPGWGTGGQWGSDFGYGANGYATSGGGGVGGGGATYGGGGFGGGGGAYGNGGFGGGGGTGNGIIARGGFGAGNGYEFGAGGGAGFGGALFNHRGTVTTNDCTWINNVARGGNGVYDGGAGSGLGGALFNLNGTVTLTHDILNTNTAAAGSGAEAGSANGAALYNLAYGNKIEDGGPVFAVTTLIHFETTGNVGGSATASSRPTGAIISAGRNHNAGNSASLTAQAGITSTAAAKNVTPTSAQVTGSAIVAIGPYTVKFRLGTSPGNYFLGDFNATPTTVNGGWTYVAANFSNLTPNVTYNYQLIAISGSTTITGNEQFFVTSTAPIVVTAPATSVTATSAVLNATVTNFGSPTTITFRYGTTSGSYPNSKVATINSTNYALTGLLQNTTYYYVASGTNAGGSGASTVERPFTTPMLPPPHVATVLVNGTTDAQRSMVESLQVRFDLPVTFATNVPVSFTLKRNVTNTVVAYTAVASLVGGVTYVNFTNFTGAAVQNGSLIDGRYTLTALASQITGNGRQLDGNGDGTPGDNYVLVGNPATAPKLFRLFGDNDGDNDVDTTDFAAFRTAFGGTSVAFDLDNDGDVDAADFGAFRARFGATV